MSPLRLRIGSQHLSTREPNLNRHRHITAYIERVRKHITSNEESGGMPGFAQPSMIPGRRLMNLIIR